MSLRKKTVLVAYDLSPVLGSESGKANNVLKIISRHYDVDVFTDAFHRDAILSDKYSNVTFHFIEGSRFLRVLFWKLNAVNISNLIFCSKVKRVIRKSLRLSEYEFIHCVTPAGIHSHNDLYSLGIPILAGPLGGALKTPKGFERAFRLQFLQNSLRDAYYWFFMRTNAWKKYFLHAKKILIGTPYLLDVLPLEVHDKTIVMFDTSVDQNIFSPNPNKKSNLVKKVLFSGLLDSKKGVLLLIEAVETCLQRGVTNFVVEMAGRGGLKDRLETIIREKKLGNHVKLLGFLTKEKMIEKYRESDIYCLPTLREPGGGAILEAMASGLPVITSDYGGPAFSVTDECGIKVPVKDPDSYVRQLADAMILLIQNDELRVRMGRKARERILKEFSLEALDMKAKNIYSQMIESK